MVDTAWSTYHGSTATDSAIQVEVTRDEVLSSGGIKLSILGDDAWQQVVTLVTSPLWTQGWMSTDTEEGSPSVDLAVVSA